MWILSQENNMPTIHVTAFTQKLQTCYTHCLCTCECHQTKITTHTHTHTPKHTHAHTKTNKTHTHTHTHTHTVTTTHMQHILHMRMPSQRSSHTFRRSPRMMSVFSALSCASSSNIMLEKNQTPFRSFWLSVKPVHISHTWSGVENVLI